MAESTRFVKFTPAHEATAIYVNPDAVAYVAADKQRLDRCKLIFQEAGKRDSIYVEGNAEEAARRLEGGRDIELP